MAELRRLVLIYLAVTHFTLHATSPSYRHQLGRAWRTAEAALRSGIDALATGPHAQPHSNTSLPASGVYASTDLLHAVQQHMTLSQQQQPLAAVTYTTTTSTPLVAYTSATGLIEGEGWRARAAFFLHLIAPRYILAASPSAIPKSIAAQLDLLHLAGQDLPAVGLMSSSSEGGAVGYELSCTSPALSMGGPQPIATCSVWLVEPPPTDAPTLVSQRLQQLYYQRSAAAARRQAAASAADDDTTSPQATTTSSSSGTAGATGDSSKDTCPARQQVATWIILQDSTPEGVAQQLQEIGAQPPPYLSGPRFGAAGGAGWLSSFLDVWLFFPRAGLMKVLPALSGPQLLLYAHAVAALSFYDLLLLAQWLHELQAATANGGGVFLGAMLGVGPWSYLMVGLSVVLQLLLMTAVRALLAFIVGMGAVQFLFLAVRGIWAAALGLQLPLLRLLGCVTDVRGTAAVAAAAVLTFAAVLRLQDVVAVLLIGFASILLLGILFGFLADYLRWDEDTAAIVSLCMTGLLLGISLSQYFTTLGPAMALPAGAASSRSWLVRQAARATAAAAGRSSLGAGAAATAAAAASGSSSTISPSLLKTASAVRRLLQPWQSVLLLVHGVSEDAVMLTVALLVWELLVPLGDALWRGCVQLASEAGVVVECMGSCLGLLLAGVGWRQVWGRFWLLVQQRLPHNHNRLVGGPFGLLRGGAGAGAGAGGVLGGGHHAGGVGGPRHIQALVIQQHQQPLPDAGQTADALRALADELDNLDNEGQQQPLFMNGRLVLPSNSNRGPKLGTHWPAPLQLEDLDLDELRDALGVEVPRGFVCPLTLDVMKQPALLISSNVAVPSTYEREAIMRWLQANRPPRDPKSRRVATDAQVVPNLELQRSIEDWCSHARASLLRHKQQQQQQQAQAAAGAAPSLGATSPLPQPAMATQAAATAGAAGPQLSGSVGSMLAAARGAVVRGTAAAAVAAATAAAAAAGTSQGRRLGGGANRQPLGGAAAAAAGLGPRRGRPFASTGGNGPGVPDDGELHGTYPDSDEFGLLEQEEDGEWDDDDLDADAVHSAWVAQALGRAAGAAAAGPPPAARLAAGAGAGAGGTAAAAAAAGGSGGRYNLRQRRPSGQQ